MFGGHKGHEVTEPDVAVRNIRDLFDKNIRSGKEFQLIKGCYRQTKGRKYRNNTG